METSCRRGKPVLLEQADPKKMEKDRTLAKIELAIPFHPYTTGESGEVTLAEIRIY
jgi:hypothetical protein